MKPSILLLLALVTQSLLALSGQTVFIRHTLSSPGKPSDLTVMDINGDGFKDLATVAATQGEIAWWQNDGSTGFTKKVVRTGFSGCRSIRGGDLDSDGDMDLAAASWSGNSIELYLNDGSEVFSTSVLDGNFAGAHTVQLVDLDQDHDLDLICSGWDNSVALSQIAWWENKGSLYFLKHIITGTPDQSPFVDVADMDGDDDLDLVATDETTGEVYWYQNDGCQNFMEYLIDDHFSLAHTAVLRDLDKDGDPDILGAACTSGLQAWYENRGGGIFEKHQLENLSGAIWLDMADFDLDGDMDLVGTGMGASQIALYTNSGRMQFTKSWINGALNSGFALHVTDLDNDQDPDIVAIGYNSNFLGWWENTSSRLSLLQSPAWLTQGPESGSYLVVNSLVGNIVKTNELDPECGLVNPRYCQAISYTNGKVYAAVGASIISYHPVTGTRIREYRGDVQYFEGLTSDPSGVLYASAPADGKIIRMDPETGQQSSLITGLSLPRAVRYDSRLDHLLVLDGEEQVMVKIIKPTNGQTIRSVSTPINAGGDILNDGLGGVFISSPSENTIYRMESLQEPTTPVVFRSGLDGPWGLCMDSANQQLIVSMASGNRLAGISLKTLGYGGSDYRMEVNCKAFPNPFHDDITIVIPVGAMPVSVIQLIDEQGKVIRSMNPESGVIRTNDNSLLLHFQGISNTSPGICFLHYRSITGVIAVPLIHQ
jgi:hypothetical protein